MEVWRDIPGWEGIYQASSLGNIRALDRELESGRWGRVRRKGGPIKAHPKGRYGQLQVGLRLNGVRKWFGVHRLVCLAFHGEPPAGKGCAAHFPDPDPTNNRPDNLVWATYQENSDHRRVHGTILEGGRNPSARLSAQDVEQIRNEFWRGTAGRPGNKAELARRFGISASQVARVANGRGWCGAA